MRKFTVFIVVVVAVVVALLLSTVGDGRSAAHPPASSRHAEAGSVELAPIQQPAARGSEQEVREEQAPPIAPAADQAPDEEPGGPYWIRGNVFDRSTDTPVANLVVWTERALTLENGVPYSVTDEFGAFAIEVPPGTHVLVFPQPLEGVFSPAPEEVVVIGADVFVTCYTYSGPLATLAGHLLSDEGAPLPGVRLEFSPFEEMVEFQGRSFPRAAATLLGTAQTQDDGSFRIELPPGELVVHSNDFKANPSTSLGDVFKSVVIEARPGTNPPLELTGVAASAWEGEIIINGSVNLSQSYILASTPARGELRVHLDETRTGARWVAGPPFQLGSLARIHLVLDDGREIVRELLLVEGRQEIDL
ncbi:carboxypeptidase-like regulatory domain-containing protein [Planctomycetes bacterium Pla133]